jgi:DNA-directed RNA polymerase subunit N (RpoN/RPB10)
MERLEATFGMTYTEVKARVSSVEEIAQVIDKLGDFFDQDF